LRDREQIDRRYQRMQAMLRAHRAALLLALIVIVILTTIILTGRGRFARAIKIDDELVALVPDKAAAEQVRSRLLEEGKDDLPGQASFDHRWEDASIPVEGREVLSVGETVEKLRPKLAVLVSAAAIEVDGREAVVMATEELAKRARDEVMRKYVGEDKSALLEPPKFRQDVRIAEVSRPADQIVTELSVAVEKLTEGGATSQTYVVRKGDWSAKIAHAHGMSLSELKELNPRVTERVLYPGDELKVSAATAPLTVVTVKEETSIKELPPETREIYTPTLPEGEREVAREGKPGKKKVWDRVVYENNQVVSRKPIRGIIIEEPQAKRVLVGTGPTKSAPAGAGR